jgi:cell division protein FtsB
MHSDTNQGPQLSRYLLYLLGGVLLLVMVFRIHPPLGFALFALAFGGSISYLVYRLLRRKKQSQRSVSAFEKRVRARLGECRTQEDRFREEAKTIMNSIRTLRDDLSRSGTATVEERQRAEEVIRDLEAEFNLRHAKAAFFTDCAAKLEELLQRHRLQESIAARKKELRELRSTNFDDEARVEELRYHLEQDRIQLDTITELSRTMAVSFKAEQAEELRVRLDALRTAL